MVYAGKPSRVCVEKLVGVPVFMHKPSRPKVFLHKPYGVYAEKPDVVFMHSPYADYGTKRGKFRHVDSLQIIISTF